MFVCEFFRNFDTGNPWIIFLRAIMQFFLVRIFPLHLHAGVSFCTNASLLPYRYMLQFEQTQTDGLLVVTLNEKRTLTDDTIYYLFRFVNTLSKQVVNVIFSSDEDESTNQDRYNQFPINIANVFQNKALGEWHYIVYEQLSSTNTDPDLATGEVERGKIKINRQPSFNFTGYQPATSYSYYEG